VRPTFSENQREVLELMFYCHFESSFKQTWVTPLDIGGYNGSHHSNTLRSLANRGLVNYKQRGQKDPPIGENAKKVWAGRGSKCYRLSPEGIELVKTGRIKDAS
jgi:hypothetical protein